MVRVDINLTIPKQKMSPEAVKRGRYALANQALSDMNQYVPMKEGILRMTATIDIDGTGINYNTPYARAQFYGFVGRGRHRVYKYTTPGTSRRWDLRAKAKHLDDWKKAYMKGADW